MFNKYYIDEKILDLALADIEYTGLLLRKLAMSIRWAKLINGRDYDEINMERLKHTLETMATDMDSAVSLLIGEVSNIVTRRDIA